VLIGSTLLAVAQERKDAASTSASAVTERKGQEVATATATSPAPAPRSGSTGASRDAAHATSILDARAMRIEGEKRFRTNCGRCHMAPPKFPPRAMATIVRHMRVRAMLTAEDAKFILEYMTQ
jgi:mono/diheme cytochrome c family protein